MKHKHSIPLLLIINCFIFQSCRKDGTLKTDNDKVYYLSFSRHALEYVRLTEGKYFIYRDSVTSIQDSVIVTKSKLDTTYTPAENVSFDYTTWDATPAHYLEEFDLILTKFEGTAQTEWFEAKAEISFTYPYASCDTVAVSLLTMFPDFGNGISFSQTTEPGDPITVEGRTYYDVVIATGDNGIQDITSPYYHRYVYYWAKGIGIIKWQTFSGMNADKSYTLVRNN